MGNRCEGVDLDVVLRSLGSESVHKPNHAQFGRAVVRLTEVAVQPRRRSRDHDSAVALIPHVIPNSLGANGRTHEVHINHEGEVLDRHVRERLVPKHTGVVDEDVNAPPAFDCLVNHGLDGILVCDIR